MFATFARNSEVASDVVYFGPMGCQTGFYFLVKNQKPADVFELTKKILADIIAYDGEMYGASAIECGNYKNLDLAAAKEECKGYLKVLEAQTNLEFTYPKE